VNDADDKVRRIKEDRLTTADLAGAGREQQKVESAGDTAAEAVTLPRVERETQEEKRPQDGRTAAASPSTTSRPEQVGQVSKSTATGTATGTGAGTATAMAKEKEIEPGPLFSSDEAANLRSQWDSIQVGFVDEPRRAVQQADALVATAMKRLAEQFAEERSRLEGQWDRGGDVSTEDLRLALRRYRSFFGRLLSV
jgi:hypothetical protein